jgi:predicted transposase YbfD/YdcC
MDAQGPRDLLRCFGSMTDPRHHNIRHRLDDMIIIAILAVICGAEGWTEVARFGRAKEGWLKTFLALPAGIPSHDTFGDLFARLDPDRFERCFMSWTASVAESAAGTLVAIDGKTIRRSFDRASSKSAIHMINAWCGANHLVLGQLATEAKDNEIVAIPKLLKLLDIDGATVTIDAIGCQKKIARQIDDQGADYVLQVKANQGRMHEQLKLTLDEAIALNFDGMAHDYVQTVDGDHGRIETRRLWCTDDIDWLPGLNEWRGIGSVAVLECVRLVGDERTCQRRYYLSSLPGDNAAALLKAVRSHWGVENQLHWSLDVSFAEDASRIRMGHAAENFSRLRRFALSLLAREPTKLGKKAKAKACGWDHDYLLKIISVQ